MEAWVKPMRKAHEESRLLGEGFESYVVSIYATDLCYWYIGGGDNVRGQQKVGPWSHLVATFSGHALTLWINGPTRIFIRPAVKSSGK